MKFGNLETDQFRSHCFEDLYLYNQKAYEKSLNCKVVKRVKSFPKHPLALLSDVWVESYSRPNEIDHFHHCFQVHHFDQPYLHNQPLYGNTLTGKVHKQVTHFRSSYLDRSSEVLLLSYSCLTEIYHFHHCCKSLGAPVQAPVQAQGPFLTQ